MAPPPATRALFEEQGFGQFAIRLRDEEPLIGFTGYRFFHDPPELHLLYGIAPAYWGRGFAPEAAHAIASGNAERLLGLD